MKRLHVLAVVAFAALACSAVLAATSWPTADITPDPLEFSDTHVGQTSDVEYFTVTNTDAKWPLVIFSIKISDATDFSVADDACSYKVLSPGETCQIGMTFSPADSGHYEASLTVISSGAHIVDTAKMTGNGIAPKVVLSATSLDFGDQTINVSSQPYEVLLVNSGNEALNITGIETAAPYSLTDDCDDAVAAGESCTIYITFTPTEVATFDGTVTLTDDAADSPQTVALTGKGMDPGTPDISFSKTSIDFGAQAIGLLSPAKTVTVKNSGTAPVIISAVTASDNFAMEDSACVKTLAAGEACVLSVVFQPVAVESYSGTITVADNVSGSPQTISLAGQGVQGGTVVIDVSVLSVDFGDVNVGDTSDPSTITVKNDGTLSSKILAVYIDGASSHSFNETDNCHGTTLAAGDSCSISAEFVPVSDDRLSAKLNILDDDSSTPNEVTLIGTGTNASDSGGCSLIR